MLVYNRKDLNDFILELEIRGSLFFCIGDFLCAFCLLVSFFLLSFPDTDIDDTG